jgi:hypothetical protein
MSSSATVVSAMSSSATVVSMSDAQRWSEWQNRGLAGDRRLAVRMKYVMALLAIALGALFGTLL